MVVVFPPFCYFDLQKVVSFTTLPLKLEQKEIHWSRGSLEGAMGTLPATNCPAPSSDQINIPNYFPKQIL